MSEHESMTDPLTNARKLVAGGGNDNPSWTVHVVEGLIAEVERLRPQPTGEAWLADADSDIVAVAGVAPQNAERLAKAVAELWDDVAFGEDGVQHMGESLDKGLAAVRTKPLRIVLETLAALSAELEGAKKALDDIAKGMIPPGLYNDDLLTDRQAFYHRMWTWSQERARAALASDHQPSPKDAPAGRGER